MDEGRVESDIYELWRREEGPLLCPALLAAWPHYSSFLPTFLATATAAVRNTVERRKNLSLFHATTAAAAAKAKKSVIPGMLGGLLPSLSRANKNLLSPPALSCLSLSLPGFSIAKAAEGIERERLPLI